MKSQQLRKPILLLSSVVLGVILAFLALELVVRLIEPREVTREFFETSDPVLHHRFIPGARGRQKTTEFDAAYEINALGLREREIPREKPAGLKRILMLGDSFTEGVGVGGKENFSSQLQEMLDESGFGTRWQIINAGVAGYSPLLEYLYLKNGGLALQPDLVILNFDLSDPNDDIQYTQLAEFDANGDPVAVRADPPRKKGPWPIEILVKIKDLFKYNTRTYNFVRRRIVRYLEAIKRKSNFSGDIRFDRYAMLRENLGPQDDHDWTLSYEYLLKIRDILEARGIDFWIVVYPYGLQISSREWNHGRQFWGFQTGMVYSGRPQELVADFGRKNGIPVINMVPDFKEASRTTYPLYYDSDGHWRAAGHRVAASALHRALVPYIREHDAAVTGDGRGR